jgi:hypothetical protein
MIDCGTVGNLGFLGIKISGDEYSGRDEDLDDDDNNGPYDDFALEYEDEDDEDLSSRSSK